MDDRFDAYELGKKAIRMKKAKREKDFDLDEVDMDLMEAATVRPVGLSDVVQVGSKVVIGAGLGLLAGVAVIAVTASAAEVIIAGVVTKIAGVVGGGAGLSIGLSQLKRKRNKKP